MHPRPNTGHFPQGLTRRSMLGATAVGAVGLLAACGDGGSDTAADPGDVSRGGRLVKTADVPVGEGVILKDRKIVVAQPTSGQFKGFSAVCTHQQCTVATIENGSILCPCHGSTFSVKDGSVTGGPAPRALSEIPVTVQGDEVVES